METQQGKGGEISTLKQKAIVTLDDFADINDEEYRVYHWADGFSVRIDAPLKLYVSKNGHRVLDSSGISHYIVSGWRHLEWKTKEGKSPFLF